MCAAVYAAQGYDAGALKAKGFCAYTLRWAAGFSVGELKQAGFDAKALKDAEVDPKALRSAGFHVSDLIHAGFGAGALKAAGFSARTLKEAGFDLNALKAARFDASALNVAGFEPDSIRIVFDIPADARSALGRQFPPNTLKAVGFGAKVLHEEAGLHDWTVFTVSDDLGNDAYEGHCSVCGETWTHVQGFGGGAHSRIYQLRPFYQTGTVQLAEDLH